MIVGILLLLEVVVVVIVNKEGGVVRKGIKGKEKVGESGGSVP